MRVFTPTHTLPFPPRYPSPANLMTAPFPIRGTPWPSTAATTTSSTAFDPSSPIPRALATSPGNYQEPRNAMEDHQRRASLRRAADDSLPPFQLPDNSTPNSNNNTNSAPNGSSTGFSLSHGHAYLPAPSQHSSPAGLPNGANFPLPSPSHQSPALSLSSTNGTSGYVGTPGSQYTQQHQQHSQHQQQQQQQQQQHQQQQHQQHQHHHHQQQQQLQQHQQQQLHRQHQHQLPSPTQHSAPTTALGSTNGYHHAPLSSPNYPPSSGPNYALSPGGYPVMAAPQYRAPTMYHMPPPGTLSTLHHPQGHMAMVQGSPHMHHMQQSPYMYGGHGAQQQTTAERPFRCDECPQAFSRNHDLKRHKRIHLAVKPFPCNFCNKEFSRKDALKRHRLVKGCEEKAQDRLQQAQEERQRRKKAQEGEENGEGVDSSSSVHGPNGASGDSGGNGILKHDQQGLPNGHLRPSPPGGN